MMRTMRNTVVAFALAGALIVGLGGCGGDDDGGGAAEGGGDSDAAVVIENFEFTLQPVAAGEDFTVDNRDSATHTVTADDGAFDIEVGGDSTAAGSAPAQAGEYAIHCEIHPRMTGTLVVE